MTAGVEAEQEVDLGRYGRAIARRWWIVLGAALLGALIGWLVSLGGGDVYRATATVYLGQPLSPSGSAQIQSLATNPATVGQIVRSQAVVRDVAEEVGIRPAKLRSGISTKTVSGAVARQGQNPLVEVTVRGPWRRESAEAANLLAARVVDEVDASYTEVKIRTLTDQLDSLEMQLGSVDARLDELADAVLAPGLDSTGKLTLGVLLTTLEQRRAQIVEDLTTTEQLLTLAENVEASRIVTDASSSQVAARNRRNSIVVGAVVGLLAGIALALLVPALRFPRTKTAA